MSAVATLVLSALFAVPATAALLAIVDAAGNTIERALLRAGGTIAAVLAWLYWLDTQHWIYVGFGFALTWVLQIATYLAARLSAGRAPLDDL